MPCIFRREASGCWVSDEQRWGQCLCLAGLLEDISGLAHARWSPLHLCKGPLGGSGGNAKIFLWQEGMGRKHGAAILLEHPLVGNGSVLPFGWTRAVLWGLVFAAGICAHPVQQKQGCRCPPEHPLHPGEVSHLLSILDLAAQVFPV